MEAMSAVDPELDALGMKAETAPVIGTRDFAGMSGGETGCMLFKQSAAFKRTALRGDGGADLAFA